MEHKPATNALLRHVAIPVWAALMLATVLSWWLGGGHGPADGDRRLTLAVILVLSFVKVYLVGEFFMELRHAPLGLRGIFGGWIVMTCAVLVALCLRT
jgi:hypothetical protein